MDVNSDIRCVDTLSYSDQTSLVKHDELGS